MEPEVLNRLRLGQAENKSTTQMGAGRLMFTTTENNILILESGCRSEILFIYEVIHQSGDINPIRSSLDIDTQYLPDVEVFCVATAATEETRSHNHLSSQETSSEKEKDDLPAVRIKRGPSDNNADKKMA